MWPSARPATSIRPLIEDYVGRANPWLTVGAARDLGVITYFAAPSGTRGNGPRLVDPGSARPAPLRPAPPEPFGAYRRTVTVTSPDSSPAS